MLSVASAVGVYFMNAMLSCSRPGGKSKQKPSLGLPEAFSKGF